VGVVARAPGGGSRVPFATGPGVGELRPPRAGRVRSSTLMKSLVFRTLTGAPGWLVSPSAEGRSVRRGALMFCRLFGNGVGLAGFWWLVEG